MGTKYFIQIIFFTFLIFSGCKNEFEACSGLDVSDITIEDTSRVIDLIQCILKNKGYVFNEIKFDGFCFSKDTVLVTIEIDPPKAKRPLEFLGGGLGYVYFAKNPMRLVRIKLPQ